MEQDKVEAVETKPAANHQQYLSLDFPPREPERQSNRLADPIQAQEQHLKNTSPPPDEPPQALLPPAASAEQPDRQPEIGPTDSVNNSSANEKEHASSEKNLYVPWKPGRREYLVLIVLSIASFVVALDSSIIPPTLVKLSRDLHGSGIQAFWVGTSYLLANAVCQPFIAALSDIFGRRALLLISVSLFTVGGIVAGVAQSFAMLFAGRSIQGIGGGGILTLNLVILTDIVPLRDRPTWLSLSLTAWALGTILGPIIGGVFANETTWRWVFWITYPFCGIALVMVPLVVKLRMKETTFVSKLQRVDWIGGVLFIGGGTSFLVAISWGGIQYAWGSFRTLVPMILGIFGVVMAVTWDIWFAKEPFLRKGLFYEISAFAGYFGAWVQGLVLFVAVYYLTLYLQAVKERSPLSAGLGLLPITISFTPGSIVTGLIISRTGRFRWGLWTGWTLATLTAGLLIMQDADMSTAAWAAIFVFFGLAQGLLLNSVNFALQSIAKEGDEASAAAMYAFFRTLGNSVGVAVGGTTFQNGMKRELRSQGLPESIARDAEAYIAELKALPETSALRQDVKQAYTKGCQDVWIVVTSLSAGALCASMLIKHFSMDRLLVSKHKFEQHEDIEGGQKAVTE